MPSRPPGARETRHRAPAKGRDSGTPRPRNRQGKGSLWALALACILLLLYLGISYFAETPLSDTIESVSYYPDLVWDLGIAADALHHWPITDPNVAGTPLSYYNFVFIDLAAVSHVTGLPLPLVLFRLYVPTLLLLLVVQLYLFGTTVGRTPRAGLLTVILVLFVGEFDWEAGFQNKFLHVFFPDLYLSPTFLLGLVLFVPLVVELCYLLDNSTITRKGLGNWLIVGLFLIGCGGAKGTILPVMVGALGLTLLFRSWAERRISWAALVAFTSALLALGVFYLLSYGNSGVQPSIRLASSLYAMGEIGPRLRSGPLAGLPRIGWVAYLVVLAFAGLMGIRVVGLAWLAWVQKLRFSGTQAWLLSLFVISLIPYYALGQAGESQIYFFWYGYVAAGALAAEGLDLLAQRCWRLPFLARVPVLLPLVALLTVQILDTPLDNKENIDAWRAGRPTYAQSNRNLTSGLLQGMDWIRLNTGLDSVLAVNNYYSSAGQQDARYYYYAAFAERRVFLEGWMYSSRTHALGYADVSVGRFHPFPERFELNQQVFEKGDLEALRLMVSQYGVSHLLVDRVHGAQGGAKQLALDGWAALVFANNDVEIYKVELGQ